MTNPHDQYEALAANHSVIFARDCASRYAKQDLDAAAIAILIRALELATPELSPERRASLFTGDE
jgi:hypothetical protein